jgi:hypothetical protein
MKLKKILSLTMALAMAFALAIPALAADEDDDEEGTSNITVSATPRVGEIDITIAPNGAIVLNPYQMKATAGDSDTVGSYHQIYSSAVSCENKSTFGLKVNAVITGAKGEESGAQFVAALPKDTTTTKDVFLYAEFGVSNSATKQPEWATEYNKSNANQVLISGSASTSKTVATLGATDGTNANYLWYKFDGALAKTPSTAWTENDTVSATVALTLTPTIDTVYKINLVNTVSKTAAGTATLNYDLAPAGVTISVACEPDNDLPGTPTVTAVQGTTKLTISGGDDNSPFTFEMPAGEVTVTVKWTAS